MTGARKRKHVRWMAASEDSDRHAFRLVPDRAAKNGTTSTKPMDTSLCGLPKPSKPVRGVAECRPCRVSMGQTW